LDFDRDVMIPVMASSERKIDFSSVQKTRMERRNWAENAGNKNWPDRSKARTVGERPGSVLSGLSDTQKRSERT
jgi:hypothetical protein